MTVEVVLRASTPADQPEIEALLRDALGKHDDPHYPAYLRWKHEENAFGRSPAWVATDAGTIVAFRTFLRWQLHDGEAPVRTARAVDTATAASHRGQGLFQRLTLLGLDELRAEGTAFVFNTPNDASRPGYLKMGWAELGRVPVHAALRGPRSALAMWRSRVPAALWSEPSEAGRPAGVALADPALVARLVPVPANGELTTHRSPAYLAWRYGFEPLCYRVVALDDDPEQGVAVFRLRRRGEAVEAAVAEVLLPTPDPARARRLVQLARRAGGADYAVYVGGGRLAVPGQGPRLVWRAVTAPDRPVLDRWRLSLGDLELF